MLPALGQCVEISLYKVESWQIATLGGVLKISQIFINFIQFNPIH